MGRLSYMFRRYSNEPFWGKKIPILNNIEQTFYQSYYSTSGMYYQLKESADAYYLLSAFIGCMYLFMIIAIRSWMTNRKAYNLRIPLVAWNVVLTIFSAIGAWRTGEEAVDMIYNHGLRDSICKSRYYDGSTAFWVFVFTASKLVEFGDTVFILLRKQRLLFLHWFHHLATYGYAILSLADYNGPGRWFMCMNFSVHSIMYVYYALRAAGVKVPRVVNVIITTCQVMQMFIGVTIFASIAFIRLNGGQCEISAELFVYGFLMYFSYLVMFIDFFLNTYVRRHPVTKKVE